jgi:predicted cytidylate kinase
LLVTISGLPGSGTSTVATAVAAALGVPRLDGGTVFRQLAAEAGESLAGFSTAAEADPATDLELDARLAAAARGGDVVLESRLAGWIATNEALPALRVWVACDEEERARRVGAREGIHPDAALAANRAREASEALRYLTYYGIDIADLSPYDLVLDSTATPPDDLVATILQEVNRRQ